MQTDNSEQTKAPPWDDAPVLLTGATGFVGRTLYPKLRADGWEVRCASRRPQEAAREWPDRDWLYMDVEDADSIGSALEGCGSAMYLVHQMGGGPGYAERERQSAALFREQCERHDVRRVVYLGGVAPPTTPSKHLASRLEAGRVLRRGDLSTIELRAAMIIGEGSESWQIVRDLAERLPVMVLPKWTRSKSQPVAISDVVEALSAALSLPAEAAGWYDIPGPDVLTVRQILMEVGRQLGREPLTFDVPLLSPKLSSYWLRFVTTCDAFVARQLVQGLKTDLLAASDEYWRMIDHLERTDFQTAVRRVLADQ